MLNIFVFHVDTYDSGTFYRFIIKMKHKSKWKVKEWVKYYITYFKLT